MFDCRVTLVSILSSLNERGIILKCEDIIKLLQFETPIKEGIPRDLVFNVLGEEILRLRGLDMKRYPSNPSENVWEVYDRVAECWSKLEKLRDLNLAEQSNRKMWAEGFEEIVNSSIVVNKGDKSEELRKEREERNSRTPPPRRKEEVRDDDSILGHVAAAYIVNRLVSGSDYSSSSSSSYECSSSSNYDSGSSCSSWDD